MRFLPYAWALPNTLLGLLGALVAGGTGGRVAWREGVFEACGGRLALLNRLRPEIGIAAITFGHVILATDAGTLERTRAHELIHVRQYEAWGPFFIPAYLVASLMARLRGGHSYYDNRFEREARARD
jgi:hypothetical protein